MNSSIVPMKYQVYESIKDSIVKGEFKPGEHIPGEMELC